ncbi:MAG: hypothetical protein ACXVEL_05270 [Nocardioidaceae bacterium]
MDQRGAPYEQAGSPSPGRVLLEPALWAVLGAGIAHVVRQNYVDIATFFGIAAVIVADAFRVRPRVRPFGTGWTRRAMLAVCVAYALLVLPLARSGLALQLVLAVPGAVALWLVWRVGRSSLQDAEPTGRTGYRWLWPSVLVVGCLFELYNFVLQPNAQTDSFQHPTLSAIGTPLLAWPVSRAVVAGLWLAIGFWLLRAIGRPGAEEADR